MATIQFNFLFSSTLGAEDMDDLLPAASETVFTADKDFNYVTTGSFIRQEADGSWQLSMRAATNTTAKEWDALLEGATDDIFGSDPAEFSDLQSSWWDEVVEEDADTGE